jgi:hypothetical protein
VVGGPLPTYGNVTINGTLVVDARNVLNMTSDMFDIPLFNYTGKTDPTPKETLVLIGGDPCLEVKDAKTSGISRDGGKTNTFVVRVRVGLRDSCFPSTMEQTTTTQPPEFPIIAVAAGAAGGFCFLLLSIIVGILLCRRRNPAETNKEVELTSKPERDARRPVDIHAPPIVEYEDGNMDTADKRKPVDIRAAVPDGYSEIAMPPGEYNVGKVNPDEED